MVEDFRDQREEAAARARHARNAWAVAPHRRRRPPAGPAGARRRASPRRLSRDQILRRRPASTATVIASIAIGIGLNTALFTVVRGVLWQSLPFAGSDRLVRVVEVDPRFRIGSPT